MGIQSRAPVSIGSSESDIDQQEDGRRLVVHVYEDRHTMHSHAREMRRGAGVVAPRSWHSWMTDPIVDNSAYGRRLAEDEMARQDDLNRSMVKMLAAIIAALLVVLVLA